LGVVNDDRASNEGTWRKRRNKRPVTLIGLSGLNRSIGDPPSQPFPSSRHSNHLLDRVTDRRVRDPRSKYPFSKANHPEKNCRVSTEAVAVRDLV